MGANRRLFRTNIHVVHNIIQTSRVVQARVETHAPQVRRAAFIPVRTEGEYIKRLAAPVDLRLRLPLPLTTSIVSPTFFGKK